MTGHLAALLLLGTACGLPRDADGTLDRLRRGGALRVGVVPAPPWVVDSGGTVGGVEGALVQELAREVGTRPVWVRRAAPELLEALHRRELDLVVGGLTDALPWKSQVAFTAPYYTDTLVVGARAGSPEIRGVRGQTVAVEAGAPVAADVRRQHATPMLVDDLARAPALVAAPTWQLAAIGRVTTGIVLGEARHVWAAAPGENAWLVRIERLLRARRASVPERLRGART